MHLVRAEVEEKVKIAGRLFFGKKIWKKRLVRDPDLFEHTSQNRA